MKGIIFTELTEMVENTFSVDVMDQVFDKCDLESGGAYTSVGTYHYSELLEIVTNLSVITGVPVGDLIMAFGDYLFKRFTSLYPQLFDGVRCPLKFLESVEGYIHVEVRKLYPDADLPTIDVSWLTPDSVLLKYESQRPFAAVAHALIKGCLKHFGGSHEVARVDNDSESRAEFKVTPAVA